MVISHVTINADQELSFNAVFARFMRATSVLVVKLYYVFVSLNKV